MPNRKQVAEIIGIGERQLQRYIKLASQHLNIFKNFRDENTNVLIGMPIENDEQIQLLKAIRSLNLKYKNTKNKTQLIALELKKINEGGNNGQG
jgi:hypothetical protein